VVEDPVTELVEGGRVLVREEARHVRHHAILALGQHFLDLISTDQRAAFVRIKVE